MWMQYGFIVVELLIHVVSSSMWLDVQLVKLSTFSLLCLATVRHGNLTLIHLSVLTGTVQCQLMYQPWCVTDVRVAASHKRFSSFQPLSCVIYRETETSSISYLVVSRVLLYGLWSIHRGIISGRLITSSLTNLLGRIFTGPLFIRALITRHCDASDWGAENVGVENSRVDSFLIYSVYFYFSFVYIELWLTQR